MMANAAINYDEATLEQVRRLGSSTLYEASGVPSTSVDPAIRTVWPGASVAGAAYPVECAPGDNLAIHIAMERVPRGSVLVVSAAGFIAGYWGEVLTVAAEAAGVAGLVIDGGVRDIAALRARKFPAFVRGISVRGTLKDSAPSVGQPFSFAGTPVAIGDLVIADDDGVVIIPAENVEATLSNGQARADKEAKMMDQLKDGRTTLDLLGLSKWRQV
jgi:4-hydroxy-4-methyl-2-oxoglutarate aldolase